jgi:hypothetical protein
MSGTTKRPFEPVSAAETAAKELPSQRLQLAPESIGGTGPFGT